MAGTIPVTGRRGNPAGIDRDGWHDPGYGTQGADTEVRPYR